MDEPERLHHLAEAAAEVGALHHAVASGGRDTYRGWRPRIGRADFAASALNLAHYLILRRRDLRPLQRRLMALGLSSLGRLESRVLPTLSAVGAALAAMGGEAGSGPRPPSERQFFAGEHRLARNADTLLGVPAVSRHGRIMVTLGAEAAADPAFLADLVRRGTDLVRINCAHDDPDVWARMVANARAAPRAGGRVRVLMDIAGPKLRTGQVHCADRSHLKVGDSFLLCHRLDPAAQRHPFQSTCTAAAVLDRLKPGDRVSIDDGVLRGSVAEHCAEGFVIRIEDGRDKGLRLKPGRSLLFPGVDLGLEPLSAQDRADLDFVAAEADLIGYSFVESAADIALLQEELRRRRPDWTRLGILAKIETPRAVANLPDIIVEAAGRQPLGVMIARGDLAIELGFERLAEMQEEILWLCEAAHVPAVWATQVLEGLVKKGMPSRGEMTDAAMATRAECVMLNKGPNIGQAVDALDRLLRRMGEHQVKKTPTLRALKSWALPGPAQPPAAQA